MKIETYEIEPASTEIETLANDGEAKMLCEELGLTGQLSLVDNKEATFFPYRHMTNIEMRVFKVHCPMQTNLTSYKSDVIPVRVLQVAAHALKLGKLHHIEVWHPKDAKLDPVLVGYTTQYGGDLYLLARWGEAWKDFTVLLSEAKKHYMSVRKAKLDKAVQELAQHQRNLSQDTDLFFAGEDVDSAVYFSS